MRRSGNDKGFTLVELAVVVAIIAVLAAIAGTAYRRYMDSGRTAEAMAMLGEIRAKEEAYRAEFNKYLGWSSGSELASKSLPAVDNQACFVGTKEPCPKSTYPTSGFTSGGWVQWGQLGITSGKAQMVCGYTLNTDNEGAAGTIGAALLPTTPTAPWWYAIAQCDNDGNTALNATFATASITTVVSAQNEHR